MECDGQLRIDRYGVPGSNNDDGIYLRGKMAIGEMTRTFIKMLVNVYPHLNNQRQPTQNKPYYNRDNSRTYSKALQNRVNSGKF